MQIDPSLNTKADNYKLLTSLVIPRPIAWVSSQNKTGIINLAPFSFFNAVGTDPLYIIISIGKNEAGETKNTANNIGNSGEFVVNLVTEDLLNAMNISAAAFPDEQSELAAIGLHTAPSIRIQTPRVKEAQASLECKLYSAQSLGENTLFIAEVVMFHIADHLVGSNLHIDNFTPVGRLGSPSMYCRTADRFDFSAISYDQWKQAMFKVNIDKISG